ncbi:MAG: universal stress protein [Bacteroidetes bacterium]|nr:universal stress protein [Bacteroidota bacterium]
MKKILCPIDFSELSRNAMSYACKLGHALGGSVTLFNVQSLAEKTPEQALFGEATNVDAATAQLEEWAQEATRVFHVSCYPEVDSTVMAMSKLIRERAASFDLVVMGTNGADDWFDVFLGSNTYQVLKKSDVPVLLVPEGCLFSEIRNIVFAFDYLHQEVVPISQLMSFAKSLNCGITIFQVLDHELNPDEGEDLKVKQGELAKMFQSAVTHGFEAQSATSRIEAIRLQMSKPGNDLLALCPVHHKLKDRLFHKSLVKEVSDHPDFPVMVFHS